MYKLKLRLQLDVIEAILNTLLPCNETIQNIFCNNQNVVYTLNRLYNVVSTGGNRNFMTTWAGIGLQPTLQVHKYYKATKF